MGGREEELEDIEPRAIHGIGDQRLAAEILGLDEIAAGQWVVGGGDENRRVVEERGKLDTVDGLGVRRDDHVHLFPRERPYSIEGQTGADIDIHIGPGLAELFQNRKEPFETGVAFDGDVQAGDAPLGDLGEFLLEGCYLRQDRFGRRQKPLPRRRQLQGPRAADEERHAELILDPLDLMAERRLGGVQKVGCPRHAAGIVDRLDRAQVAELDIHEIFSY